MFTKIQRFNQNSKNKSNFLKKKGAERYLIHHAITDDYPYNYQRVSFRSPIQDTEVAFFLWDVLTVRLGRTRSPTWAYLQSDRGRTRSPIEDVLIFRWDYELALSQTTNKFVGTHGANCTAKAIRRMIRIILSFNLVVLQHFFKLLDFLLLLLIGFESTLFQVFVSSFPLHCFSLCLS